MRPLEFGRWDAALLFGVAAANVAAFVALGFHARVPIWIFSFGYVDLGIGTGFLLTGVWVIPAIAENDRDRRIMTAAFWMVVGLVMLAPSLLRG